MRAEARERAEEYRRTRVTEATNAAAARLEEGRAQIAQARAAELERLRAEAVECVGVACGQLLGSSGRRTRRRDGRAPDAAPGELGGGRRAREHLRVLPRDPDRDGHRARRSNPCDSSPRWSSSQCSWPSSGSSRSVSASAGASWPTCSRSDRSGSPRVWRAPRTPRSCSRTPSSRCRDDDEDGAGEGTGDRRRRRRRTVPRSRRPRRPRRTPSAAGSRSGPSPRSSTEQQEMLLELREQLVELVSSATRSIMNEKLTVSEQRTLIENTIVGEHGVERRLGCSPRRPGSRIASRRGRSGDADSEQRGDRLGRRRARRGVAPATAVGIRWRAGDAVRPHPPRRRDHQGGSRARVRGCGSRDRPRRQGVADDGRRCRLGRRRRRAGGARPAHDVAFRDHARDARQVRDRQASRDPADTFTYLRDLLTDNAPDAARRTAVRHRERAARRRRCRARDRIARRRQPGDRRVRRRRAGLAFSLKEQSVGVVLLGGESRVREGGEVRRTGHLLRVPAGEGVLGRVVDAVGQPLDGRGPVVPAAWMPVERPAPGIVDRRPVDEPLHTGMKVIDALVPVGRGQRELIIGDRKVGKTTLAIDAILAQKGANVSCIYCAIGQKASTVRQVVATLEERGALEYTAVVVALPGDMPALRYLAPYAACALGEYFMDRGGDALVVYDDLTKHAVTYREMSALLDRPVGREAYPGDIFYVHSRLLERAARLCEEKGSGSLTALPIVETLAGDISGVHPDERHLHLRRADRARHRRVQREPTPRDGSRALGVARRWLSTGARDEAGRRAAAHRPRAVQRDGAVREVRCRGRREHAAAAHARGARAGASRPGPAFADGISSTKCCRSTRWSTATSTPCPSTRRSRSRRRCWLG